MTLRQYWPSAFNIQLSRPARHRVLTPVETHRDKSNTETMAGDGPFRIHCLLSPDGEMLVNPDNTPRSDGRVTPPLLGVEFPVRPFPPRLYCPPILRCAACEIESNRLLMACIASEEGELEKCCGRALCTLCTYDWLGISCTCFACGARAECYEQCGIGTNISVSQAGSTDNPLRPRIVTDDEKRRFAEHRRSIRAQHAQRP